MPVTLGSLDRVDLKVVAALRQIADAVNNLENKIVRPVSTAVGTGSAAGVALVEQQVQALGAQVRQLQSVVTGVAAAGSDSIVGTPNVTPSTALPLFDGSAIVAQVFADHPDFVATSCQHAEGGTWDLMDAIVDALRAADPRFAYNGKRGNANDPSLDAIAYDYGETPGGEGATTVYIIDVIAGHCGPTPAPAWQDVTVFAPGVWISRGRF